MEENKEILETPVNEENSEKIEETYKEMSPIQLILRRFFSRGCPFLVAASTFFYPSLSIVNIFALYLRSF